MSTVDTTPCSDYGGCRLEEADNSWQSKFHFFFTYFFYCEKSSKFTSFAKLLSYIFGRLG